MIKFVPIKAVSAIQETISKFNSIRLNQLIGDDLMNRTDTKFLVSRTQLISILNEVIHQYKILEIDGIRLNHYETLYYDTKEFEFYKRHHNGKRNRWKIRKRSYVDSQMSFLELKFKTNQGRTLKQRTGIPSIIQELNANEENYIGEGSGIRFHLFPQLNNTFTRLTLIELNLQERVTIDIDLAFTWNSNYRNLREIVIVEVKQERRNRLSPFIQALKKRHIREESISKYCLGVAMLVPFVKKNNFKEKLIKVNKLELLK